MQDDEKQTQEQIGVRIGWSRKRVSDYTTLIDKIAPQNLEIAKKVQIGRGAIEFTEGGLRDRIGLNQDNQNYLM